MLTMWHTIILDRDGVINELREPYVVSLEEFEFITGVTTAIKTILSFHVNVVIVSNQAGVAKGLVKVGQLKKISEQINRAINSEIEFFYCPHTDEQGCMCRKPKPGLLARVIHKYPGPFLFVGDNVTDFQAADAIGISYAHVLTGHGQKYRCALPKNVPVYRSLVELVADNFPVPSQEKNLLE